MPRKLIYILLLLASISLIPMGYLYKSTRNVKSKPRIQVVYDMDNQNSFGQQKENDFFDDNMSMRQYPEGTVARGQLYADNAYYRGIADDGEFITEIPVEMNMDLLERGQDRFNIYCTPCHGLSGNGDGLVHRHAAKLAEGLWVPPSDVTGQVVVDLPSGSIFNTISNGIRTMPAHGSQIPHQDRWAIVAYIRALQLSRNAKTEDLPADTKAALMN
jgi:mono/diheme cytochrome c family protein